MIQQKPWRLIMALLAMVFALQLSANEPIKIEEMVVTSKRPGPPLWRLDHQGNTLWLLRP